MHADTCMRTRAGVRRRGASGCVRAWVDRVEEAETEARAATHSLRHWFRLASASISASLSFSRLALDSNIGGLGSPKICVVTNVRLAAMRECFFRVPLTRTMPIRWLFGAYGVRRRAEDCAKWMRVADEFEKRSNVRRTYMCMYM